MRLSLQIMDMSKSYQGDIYVGIVHRRMPVSMCAECVVCVSSYSDSALFSFDRVIGYPKEMLGDVETRGTVAFG